MKQLLSLVALSLAACVGDRVEGEQIGQAGRVAFSAETELVFSQRLLVGSSFAVQARALDDVDEDAFVGARLQSSDPGVFDVADGIVQAQGAGEADLLLVGDAGELDRVSLRVGRGTTTLVSGALVAATDTVDARLPSTFAVRTDVDTALFVAAVDDCGGELLDLHASSLETSGDVPVAVDAASPARFVVSTQVPGDLVLTLKTPGNADLAFQVRSVDSSQVDEVDVAVTAAEGDLVTLVGRAFVDDVEIVSPLSFSWAGAPRVVLEQAEGQAVRARIAFPAEGEPPDDTPATVTAEVFGETGSIDVLTATLATSFGTPARTPPTPDRSSASSCQGSGCDAAAALAFLGLGGLRRLRRMAFLVRPLTER